jgi:hypothetical protein
VIGYFKKNTCTEHNLVKAKELRDTDRAIPAV